MASSLEKLVDSLTSDKNNFKHFNEHFKNYTQEQRDILTKKGVFPYDFMTSFDKFNYDNFPSIEECYNQLNNEDMTEEDYNRALNVWDLFKLNNMGEYHDLYLTTDVLLLSDVFENFRNTSIINYGL